MKRMLTSLALAGLLLLAAAPGLAAAADPGSDRPRYSWTIGEVASVDAAEKSFVVRRSARGGYRPETLTIHTSPTTTYKVNGERVDAAALRGGETVRVTYRVDGGKNVASTVSILEPAGAGRSGGEATATAPAPSGKGPAAPEP